MIPRTAAAFAIAAAAATSASAAFVGIDDAPALTRDGRVSVQLVGAWAGAAGDVYFLGADTGAGFVSAPASDAHAIGQRLFNSKDAPGAAIDLGDFAAGDQLHFAYRITKGWSSLVTPGDVMTTQSDLIQFGIDESASDFALRWRLGMEDIRDPKRSDWDYQDAVFDVLLTPARGIPTPASAALFAIAGLTAIRRRR
jgi:hypothetical protein